MVRSCVSRARESLGALGRAERDNDSGQDEHLREFHLNLVVRSRTRNDRHFLPDSRAPNPSSSRVFEFAASHVSLQSVALSCIVWSSRVARRASPARVSRPCHARSPGPAIARGRGVSRVVRRVSSATFQSRKARAGSSRERGSEALRRSKRSAWQPSIVSVSRLALVLSRVSMLTAPVSRTRAARRPSDGALATLRRPLPETAASSAKKTLRAVDGARPTLSYPRLLMNGNASRPAGASRTCLNLHWSPL